MTRAPVSLATEAIGWVWNEQAPASPAKGMGDGSGRVPGRTNRELALQCGAAAAGLCFVAFVAASSPSSPSSPARTHPRGRTTGSSP